MPIYKPEETTGPYTVAPNVWEGLRRLELDGRSLAGGMVPQAFADQIVANTLPDRLLYMQLYRVKPPIPMELLGRQFIFAAQTDWTGQTALPDAPDDAALTDYLYYYQTEATAKSLGTTGIADVPTTWRQYTGLYRIVLERNELTAAQQMGIIAGIEREIVEGLGSLYASASAATRYIDFAHNSSGANEALDQAPLVALGWSVVSDTQLEKFYNDATGTARRWRILHNN